MTKEQFIELAKRGNLIPVYREMVADLETPVSAFIKLDTGSHTFLLESAEGVERFGRYSFVGSDPHIIFSQRGRRVTVSAGGVAREFDTDQDPLVELKKLMDKYQAVAVPDLPLFSGGAVGWLSYEAIRYFEPTVPRAANDDLQLPDAYFIVSDTLLIFDHLTRRLRIVANAHVTGSPAAAYDAAVQKIAAIENKLRGPISHPLLEARGDLPTPPSAPNMTKDEYLRMTARMQEHIGAGDIFQVVPSQRFAVPFNRDAIELYRALRYINPSPYMFCLKLGGVALVGSSPETHVRCVDGKIEMHPIAGTRPRQATAAADAAMARELLADPKERAEHLMLVDLARNDVGRVCRYNSVQVTDFMTIEKYSHVMHIVSHVVGQLNDGYSSYDVLRATFPAGTVSGSPKIRAMQIIAAGEPTCRGTYSGAVGYFGFSGNLDSCILIRTVLLKNGTAYIQAGGGLVADSTPLGEYNESASKAQAAMKALALAETL
ncbi:MAG: anthranilate synthase component I [Verrucomicrobiales bacterium]|jgi:anthranilate synthase component 1|nr:anthranilate synthase component I [Verrucomicrobiales bacterium]